MPEATQEPILVTDVEFRVYEFILTHKCNYGRPPSYREMSQYMGCSKRRIVVLVSSLEEKGVLYRSGGGNQGVTLTNVAFSPVIRRAVKPKSRSARVL